MSREMIKLRHGELVVIFCKDEPIVYDMTTKFVIDECEKFTLISTSGNIRIYDRTDFDFKIKQLFPTL